MTKNKRSFTFREQLNILSYLFSFTKNYKWSFLVSVVLMILGAAISAYLPLLIQTFLDEYLATQSATLLIAVRFALTYLLLELIRSVFKYVEKYLFSLASEQSVADMRNRLYQKLGHLNINYFNQTPNGEVVSRITNDTETIKEFWDVLVVFFDGISNAVMIAVAMFSLNAKISWIFIAFLPLVFLLVVVYQKVSTVVYQRMRDALAQVNARLSESIMGMDIIRRFNQKERVDQEFDDINEKYVGARINMFKMNALFLNPAVNLIQQLALATIILVFGWLLMQDFSLEIGLVYAFTSYVQSFFSPITQSMDSFSRYQDALVSGYRGMSFLADSRIEPEQALEAGFEKIEGKVEVKDVSFSYDDNKEVLTNVTLDSQSGDMIAFVGATGSGKSTMTHLLMRFYEFESGEILYDGKSIRDYSKESLRQQIGLVQQDSFMFYGNFYDNIRLHGDYSDEEVEEMARFTGAHDFIMETSDGYETLIHEGGSSISEGQKQLISITRVLLRNPSIIILDEATANIDTETESKIQNSLNQFRQNHTLIVIAHRLSTIKNADRIYVFDHGEIVEYGSHDELIEQQGRYYDMYRLQGV